MADIVFCADGTWNHPGQTVDGRPADTNVCRLDRALLRGAGQRVFYDDGVGVGGTPLEHLLGGAFGDGLLAKVRDGYQRIAAAYAEGDRIHLFGFSRGAFTARSIAGMLALCGLPAAGADMAHATTDAFAAYRDRAGRSARLATFRDRYGHRRAEVATVGVWDTVGALGIPVQLFAGLDQQQYGFLDTSLHADIGAAYHAISIDEERPEFVPTLWTSPPHPGQVLEQVWFAGVHGDVGGGYPDRGLADITLCWMMQRAQRRGLRLRDGEAALPAVDGEAARARLHDSWSPLFGLPCERHIPDDAVFASSVAARWRADAGYRPRNVPAGFPAALPSARLQPVVC